MSRTLRTLHGKLNIHNCWVCTTQEYHKERSRVMNISVGMIELLGEGGFQKYEVAEEGPAGAKAQPAK